LQRRKNNVTINAHVNKKLSYCCDSRSYCVQEDDRLKQLLRNTLPVSILTPYVIAASRLVNKNVNIGVNIRANHVQFEPGVHKLGLLANYQTGRR